jgi:hypothetical protein
LPSVYQKLLPPAWEGLETSSHELIAPGFAPSSLARWERFPVTTIAVPELSRLNNPLLPQSARPDISAGDAKNGSFQKSSASSSATSIRLEFYLDFKLITI